MNHVTVDRISPLQRKLILVMLDVTATTISFYLALVIQYPNIPLTQPPSFHLKGLIALTAVRIGIFFWFGLYDLIWKYASVFELGRIFKAVSLGTIAIIGIQWVLKSHRIPGRVLVVESLINLLAIGGIRFSLRLYRDYLIHLDNRDSTAEKEPVLIIGAGDGGELIIRELKKNHRSVYSVVGLVDDKPSKQGKLIHQVPILGTIDDIPEISEKYNIKTVIIAIPSASGNLIRRIMSRCESAGLHSKITPNLSDVLMGRVQISQVRNVAIEDLLGRDVIETDISSISDYLSEATVLITGAGGSIGSELARQITYFTPKSLILLDHAETDLYQIDMEIRQIAPTLTIHPVVADVKDTLRLNQIFGELKPTVVFHAAAYKHVPLMELNTEEVILNNVMGTRTILELSGNHQVAEFVLISTDKAVRPTSAMGATKRLCEVLYQFAQDKYPATKFTAVRFGNVLGSQGSVIPLFKQQIENGGPVTVTHPDITRYFMTIPEAIRLIIQAGALAKGGELFILDMGVPVKVVNLAADLIKLSGFSESDIKIQFTGLRPGEKLYEELFFDKRVLLDTPHKKIFVTRPFDHNLDHLDPQISLLLDSCYRVPSTQLKETLLSLAYQTFPEPEMAHSRTR